MSKFTYLARRQGGVYYLAIRLPSATGKGAKLWRRSLLTRDHREARRRALAYLKWLIPMKDATSTAELVQQLCIQLDHFILNRHAADANDVRYRTAFLNRLLAYIKEWSAAKPCPIEYKVLHEQFSRLREGAAIVNLFLADDMVRFGVHGYDQDPLAQWVEPQLEIYSSPPELPEEEVPVPGDDAHYRAMLTIRSTGSDEDIARQYFARYRSESLPLLSQLPEPEPITWASPREIQEGGNKLLGWPGMRNWLEAAEERAAAEDSLRTTAPPSAQDGIPAPAAAAEPGLTPNRNRLPA